MKNDTSSKEAFWRDYEKLPDIIKDTLFSEKSFNIISEVCEQNGLNDEESKSQLMKYVGKTLMGKLPIKDFFVTLELEMDIETQKAKTITKEIEGRIFSGLRIALNKVYSQNVAENTNLSNNKKGDKSIKVISPKNNHKDAYKESLI